MNLPNDYDSAKSYSGQTATPLPVGPHCCRIVGSRLITTVSGAQMLEIAFDIAEGSKFDGKYKARFEGLRKQNPSAKWPNSGIFRTSILTKDGKTNTFFKGLITAVEESNAGYSFKASQCNEETLKNKMVAFNFGEEEFVGDDGAVRAAVKPFYAISVKTAREGIDPPRRRTVQRNTPAAPANGFTEVHDEELPF